MNFYEVRQPYGTARTGEIEQYLRGLPSSHFNGSVLDMDGVCVATDTEDESGMNAIPANVTRCTVSDEVRGLMTWEREWGKDPFKTAPWASC